VKKATSHEPSRLLLLILRKKESYLRTPENQKSKSKKRPAKRLPHIQPTNPLSKTRRIYCLKEKNHPDGRRKSEGARLSRRLQSCLLQKTDTARYRKTSDEERTTRNSDREELNPHTKPTGAKENREKHLDKSNPSRLGTRTRQYLDGKRSARKVKVMIN